MLLFVSASVFSVSSRTTYTEEKNNVPAIHMISIILWEFPETSTQPWLWASVLCLSLQGAPGRMGQQGEPGIPGYEVSRSAAKHMLTQPYTIGHRVLYKILN